MLIQTDWSVIRKTKWHEYAVRFALGGLITAVAGFIAKEWGPVLGGLFLAFPAIFPATATLAEKRENERKHKHGLSGVRRGRQCAALEAAGTALGCIGLITFAATFWGLLPRLHLLLVFLIGIVGWVGVSVAMWFLRKRLRFRPKHSLSGARPLANHRR
ncbi:MAG TPA: hypothetical protein VKW78_07045 [Terriglobales bacterium]|nr:hypothetical protein [Terriglobales bacterium]